jgi:hypothetical protein
VALTAALVRDALGVARRQPVAVAGVGHGRIDETMLYVHVAASRMRPLPPELRAVSCPDDPDQRIVHLLGLRSTERRVAIVSARNPWH